MLLNRHVHSLLARVLLYLLLLCWRVGLAPCALGSARLLLSLVGASCKWSQDLLRSWRRQPSRRPACLHRLHRLLLC